MTCREIIMKSERDIEITTYILYWARFEAWIWTCIYICQKSGNTNFNLETNCMKVYLFIETWKPKVMWYILSFVRIRHLPLQILAAWDFNLCWLSCRILSIWLHETIFLSPWHVLQMIQHTHHTIQHYNYLCMKFIQRLNEVHFSSLLYDLKCTEEY